MYKNIYVYRCNVNAGIPDSDLMDSDMLNANLTKQGKEGFPTSVKQMRNTLLEAWLLTDQSTSPQ